MSYTADKVLEIINMYAINVKNIREYQKSYASVGVSTVTDMPQARGLSDVVANEAIKQTDENKFMNKITEEVNYLEKRIHKVKDKRDLQVVRLRMEGLSVGDIAEVINISSGTVYRLLKKSAEQIK